MKKPLDEVMKYKEMPRKEWNGKEPLYSQSEDRYFFDDDDLYEFCMEHERTTESLRLIICEPIYLRQIEEDYWADCLDEDQELPGTVIYALDKLNEAIRDEGPISWVPGKFAPTDASIQIKD